MGILIFSDNTLMYDNDVVIETALVWADSSKVDNAYCQDFSRHISLAVNITLVVIVD